MKDEKGHGSNKRGEHSAGVDQVGRNPLPQPTKEVLASGTEAPRMPWKGTWWHGSPTGEPGPGYIHLGSEAAARIALEARVGIPADGYGWHGDKEYGKTLLAGQDTLRKMGHSSDMFGASGYNAKAPKNDYYATERTERATMGLGNTPVPFDAKPAIHPYDIIGKMSDTITTDAKANGMASRLKNQGTYYKNDAEDSGSVSAVVPSKAHLRRKW